jgi:hypothetical protein
VQCAPASVANHDFGRAVEFLSLGERLRTSIMLRPEPGPAAETLLIPAIV